MIEACFNCKRAAMLWHRMSREARSSLKSHVGWNEQFLMLDLIEQGPGQWDA